MVNYSAAQQLALEKFRASSIEEIAHYSGYPRGDNTLFIPFLGEQYTLDYPSAIFKSVDSSSRKELPVPTQILILHYLTNISEDKETGSLISFKELPGGNIYIQPFTHRAIDPLVRSFGVNPDKLQEVVSHLGGNTNGHGDVGMTLRVFPRVPVALILWREDDEFPASGTILFDSSAPSILPTEDYAVLASTVVWRLKEISASL
ncbi:hypothetical protein Desaci_3572 [Desulfosporosinus acidiphilus SJ4]|uniref:DUF3786 domain-containing protein n=1 Tax=Desulfosporosinus acidiphilus (strain DSM 22704 / JCM 16185 / SJ4) TaxID=646529 RepID=I4D9H9_DESAJ|nr:DUF3786 domain-containing protein [Desulfosporosinus acidiphilus]AFM42453.1 hypothetical protein Desaci_3572 [Desulfosporosinus acidiphilus SJ4]